MCLVGNGPFSQTILNLINIKKTCLFMFESFKFSVYSSKVKVYMALNTI